MCRYELKALLHEEQYRRIVEEVRLYMAHDRHVDAAAGYRYTLRSLYFDTPNFRFYFEKIHGDRRRTKVRLRSYEKAGKPPSEWILEIKRKEDGRVLKTQECRFDSRLVLEHFRRLGTIDIADLAHRRDGRMSSSGLSTIWRYFLEPKVLVFYEREPYVGLSDFGLRLTFDSNIQACFTENPFEPSNRLKPILGGRVLEIKFMKSIPMWLHRILVKCGVRYEAISKYCYAVDTEFPLFGTPQDRRFSLEGLTPAAVALQKKFIGLGRCNKEVSFEEEIHDDFTGPEGRLSKCAGI